MEHTTGAEHMTHGRLTFTDLKDTKDFLLPRAYDAWGVLRAPFSTSLARMSAEISANGYALDIQPWLDAGWEDCAFVIEDKTIPLVQKNDSRLAGIEAEWKRRRARAMLHGVNPLADIRRAVRQLLVTDHGKAIVMTRPIEDGRYVVSITFVGTTEKFFDWFVNFKFKQDAGMHYGFLELARSLGATAAQIPLPRLAAYAGQAYTLMDAVEEAKKPDSRIILWLSGHSQGGAIVQTYAHVLLSQGVRPENIIGYTFAAPTVASTSAALDPKQYPIYNIINQDDLVPRVGMQARLGVDCVYRPGEAFRRRHYGVDENQWDAFIRMLYLGFQVQTTEDAMCWTIAVIRLMDIMQQNDAVEDLFEEMLPYLSMLGRMNLSIEDISAFAEKLLVAQFRGMAGEEPTEGRISQYEMGMLGMVEEFGAKATSAALMKVFGAPHRLRASKGDEPEMPYVAIVRKHLSHTLRGVWQLERPPRCVDAAGRQLLPWTIQNVWLEHVHPAHLLDAAPTAENTANETDTDKKLEMGE